MSVREATQDMSTMLNEQTDALRLFLSSSLFSSSNYISETIEGNVAHARHDVEAGTKALDEANKHDQFSIFCLIFFIYTYFSSCFFKRVYNLLIDIICRESYTHHNVNLNSSSFFIKF